MPNLRSELNDGDNVAIMSRPSSRTSSRPAINGRIGHVRPLNKTRPICNADAFSTDKKEKSYPFPKRAGRINSSDPRFSMMVPLLDFNMGLCPIGSKISEGDLMAVDASRKFQNNLQDVSGVARAQRLPLHEVRRIADALRVLKTDKFGQVPEEEFRKFLCRAFDVDDVTKELTNVAMIAFSQKADMTLDAVVSWYVQNMFNHVAKLVGPKDARDSITLVYELSKKLGAPPNSIDRIKKVFDHFDENGDGALGQDEFDRMLHSIFHAKTGDVCKERLRHFWMEIDADAQGFIAFPEFAQWHLKYFDASGLTCNLVGSFYDSYNPEIRRRNSIARPRQR
jgi:hypothetical protein